MANLFGPVASILRVDGDEEAIAVANDTPEQGPPERHLHARRRAGVQLAMRIEAGLTRQRRASE